VFREKLLNAKSKDRKGKEGIGGRYAVFDVEYELESGEGTRSKITFISWTPDDAPQYVSLSPEGAGWGGVREWCADDVFVASYDVLDLQGSYQARAERTCG
jgi:hypothetical protein